MCSILPTVNFCLHTLFTHSRGLHWNVLLLHKIYRKITYTDFWQFLHKICIFMHHNYCYDGWKCTKIKWMMHLNALYKITGQTTSTLVDKRVSYTRAKALVWKLCLSTRVEVVNPMVGTGRCSRYCIMAQWSLRNCSNSTCRM